MKELSGGNCLEIGCGNGHWTKKLLVPKFKTVIAIDIIEKVETDFIYFQRDTFNARSMMLLVKYSYLKQLRPLLKGKGPFYSAKSSGIEGSG